MWILVIGCNIFKCNNLLVRRCLHFWLIPNGKTAISHKCIDRIMLIFLITWHCLFSTNITCLTRVYLHAVLFNPWEQSACSILLDFFNQQQNGTISMMLWNDVSGIPLKRNNFIPISDAWCMILSQSVNLKVKLMINKVQPRKLLETQSWTNVCAMNKSLRYFILIWIFELRPVSFCKLLLWIISAFSSTFIHSVTVMNANKSCIIHCINNYRGIGWVVFYRNM